MQRGLVWMRGTATLVLLVVQLSLLPTAVAAQGSQGLQDGWAVGDQGQITGGQLLSDELGYIQQSGAGWVRVNFRLGQCFTNWAAVGCNGQTALQTYDQVLANLQAKNLKVLGLLSSEAWHGQQSDWTTNTAENTPGGNGYNAYIQAFAQSAAGVLAAHYNGTNGPLVTQWEVWNEPNAWSSSPSPGVYTGSSFMYPSNFAQLLMHAKSAIKSVNSTAMVISGGVLGLDSGGSHGGAVRCRFVPLRKVARQPHVGPFSESARRRGSCAVSTARLARLRSPSHTPDTRHCR